MPKIRYLRGAPSRQMIDFYVCTNIKHIGMGGNGYDEARDDIELDGDPSGPISQRSIDGKTKRYCAEIFIGSVVKALIANNMDAPNIYNYLGTIVDTTDKIPDHVIDAALRFQDIVVENDLDMKKKRDALIAAHQYLIPREPE